MLQTLISHGKSHESHSCVAVKYRSMFQHSINHYVTPLGSMNPSLNTSLLEGGGTQQRMEEMNGGVAGILGLGPGQRLPPFSPTNHKGV